MSGFNNYEEDDQVPGLLPLKKKHETSVVTPSDKNNKSTDTLNNIIKDSIQKTPVSVQGKDNQKSFGQFKKGPQKEPVQQMDKKTKDKKQSAKKDNQFNKLENEKTKQNEKMKTLIAQMLNSMTTKNNATEELYPVSNQIIEELMSKIDEQIAELNNEADRKSANQNNLHAEKELEVIRRQINHCGLIKELYYEKMNYRNKIQSLEEEIINLRSENRDLKLKVSRGIQSIENYKHNLPCDREKQLIQKLSICTQDLAQQKEMRQNLEKNIEGIIMNFKKLYDQADAARKIVTQKLKQVQERQRKLRKQKQSDHDYSNYVKSQKKIASPDLSQQRKQNDSRFAREESNDNQISTRREYDDNQNDRSAFRPKPLLIMTQPAQQRFKQKINEKQKEKSKQKQRQRQRQKKQKQKQKQKKLSQSQNEALTLEEKIKRMRNNQINFKKNFAN